MPRRPRVFVEGGLYHVYNRAARGDAVLESEEMAALFAGLLRRVAERDGLTVYAWCVLPNHYHVVLRSGPVPLSRTFGVVQGRFGQLYNERFQSTGPLWQSRYKAKLIEKEGYLLQLIAYVHLNPVTGGLVDDPALWEWSGHREIIRRGKKSLIDAMTVLALYGDTERYARGAYLRTLKGESREPWIGEGPGRLPWWSHEPDSQIEMPVPTAWVEQRGASSGLERPLLDAETFLRAGCQLTRVEIHDLASLRRGEKLTDTRLLLASVGIERWRQSAKQLALLLGRHADVVTRWARMGAQRRLNDSDFASRVERLDSELAAQRDIHKSTS